MNAQEKSALQDFLQEMNRVRLERKDLEADNMIRQAAQQQPDALYLLVQRALLQEQALLGMQQQVAQLQQQVKDLQQSAQERESSSSFLDSASQWGKSGNALAASTPPVPPPMTSSPSWQGAAPPMAATQTMPPWQAGQTAPAVRPGLLGGGGGSFLGSMAGVLAGAAAGSFLYQGIGHMMHRNENQTGAQNLGDMQGGQSAQANQAGSLPADNALAREAGVNDVGSASHRDLAQWEEPDAGQDSWSDSADGGDFVDGDDTA